MNESSLEHLVENKQEQRTLWLDLENVGPKKPIGYLPLETITRSLKKEITEVVQYFQDKGLVARIFTGSEWPGYSGALYVYDRAALQKLLDENKQTLLAANWPVTADEFVANLKVDVKIGSPVYRLIARAFADEFSEKLESEE